MPLPLSKDFSQNDALPSLRRKTLPPCTHGDNPVAKPGSQGFHSVAKAHGLNMRTSKVAHSCPSASELPQATNKDSKKQRTLSPASKGLP